MTDTAQTDMLDRPRRAPMRTRTRDRVVLGCCAVAGLLLVLVPPTLLTVATGSSTAFPAPGPDRPAVVVPTFPPTTAGPSDAPSPATADDLDDARSAADRAERAADRAERAATRADRAAARAKEAVARAERAAAAAAAAAPAPAP
ncbi:hypothetical protein ABT005_21110, partial [Pseudonocardia alni]